MFPVRAGAMKIRYICKLLLSIFVVCSFFLNLGECFLSHCRYFQPKVPPFSKCDKLCLDMDENARGLHSMDEMNSNANNNEDKLKILCLHGYCSSAKVFEMQTRHLVDNCADIADFTFMDGTMEFSLLNAASTTATATKPRKKRSKRMWWRSKESSLGVTYVGLKDSVLYLHDFMKKHGNFDVIVGHSQGNSINN